MLSSYDEQIVRRDAHVPGLRLLFDPSAFLATLQGRCPDLRATRAQPWYVRYKPGTSCLAAFTVETARGPVEMYGKAYQQEDRPKLEKALAAINNEKLARPPSLPTPVVFEEAATIVRFFPDDGEITAMADLANPVELAELLGKVMPEHFDCAGCTARRLAYKPERRFVAQLIAGDGTPRAVLKLCSPGAFARMSRNAKVIESGRVLRVGRRLGRSERHSALAMEWIEGDLLADQLSRDNFDLQRVRAVGEALAELHEHPTEKLSRADSRQAEAEKLGAIANAVAHAHPRAADRVQSLAARVAEWLLKQPTVERAIHGDFYAEQILLQNGATVALLDLDEVRCGDPAVDLANFAAHLERHALTGRFNVHQVQPVMSALRKGYADAGGLAADEELGMYTALCLLRLTPQPFRTRQLDWPRQIEALLERVEALCEAAPNAPSDVIGKGTRWRSSDVVVADHESPANDPAIPFLRRALDQAEVQQELDHGLVRPNGAGESLLLRAIRVIRHKAGRRCIVEYDVERRSGEMVTLVGKIRAKGLDESTFSLNLFLRQSGFDETAPDGVAVPEPVGVIPAFRMWLQHKVQGDTATDLVEGELGVVTSRKLAEVAAKLHHARLPSRRRHTVGDELRILNERLATVRQAKPQWEARLHRLLGACEQLAEQLPAPVECGIHRDYYPGQVIIDGSRAYLLDLDMYCQGDPALDVGNCIAHLIESALRTAGSPTAWADREAAFVDRYTELAGQDCRGAADIYATLALVRHIHISTQFPDRALFTESILSLCERRLHITQDR